MEPAFPVTGVVIPTTGKPSLPLVLRSLVRQDFRNFRVVVSFDGPSPFAEEIRREFSGLLSLHVVEPAADRGSAAATRNSGFRRCLDLQRIVVVDDDCLCPPDFVRIHNLYAKTSTTLFGLRRHISRESAVSWVGGASLELLPETKPEMRASPGLVDKLQRLSKERSLDLHRFVYTCQASFPVWAVVATGGMWEDMKGSGFEDLEFALRLHRAGAPATFLPRPYVYHVDHPKCPRQTDEAGHNKSMYWLAMHSDVVKRNGGIWRVGDDFDDGPWSRPRRH